MISRSNEVVFPARRVTVSSNTTIELEYRSVARIGSLVAQALFVPICHVIMNVTTQREKMLANQLSSAPGPVRGLACVPPTNGMIMGTRARYWR